MVSYFLQRIDAYETRHEVGIFNRHGALDYYGLAILTGYGNWHLTIGRDNDTPPMEQIFNAEVLANQLRQAGMGVESVKIEHGSCVVRPTNQTGRPGPEDRKILGVLKKHYPTHNGQKIHWRWNVRMYD